MRILDFIFTIKINLSIKNLQKFEILGLNTKYRQLQKYSIFSLIPIVRENLEILRMFSL